METGWRRGWGLAGDMGTLLLAQLHKLRGTIAHRYGVMGTVPGCGWWTRADWCLKATRLCQHNTEPALAHFACLWGRLSHVTRCDHFQVGAGSCPIISKQVQSEPGAGWLQPCIHGLYFLISLSPSASVFFLHIPKLYQGASELMGSPEVLLEIIKITTQSTILARVQQMGSVSNQFSLY